MRVGDADFGVISVLSGCNPAATKDIGSYAHTVDKVCKEAKIREDLQQPLSFFSPNAGIKHQMALQISSNRYLARQVCRQR